MIDSLHIKNFQVFEDIEIKGLRRVNLIAGKNNAGKTAMLEALRILAARGENTVVNNILKSRGNFRSLPEPSYDRLFNRNYLRQNKEIRSVNLEINDIGIQRFKQELSAFPKYSVYDINGLLTNHSKTNPRIDLAENYDADNPSDVAVYIPFSLKFANFERLWTSIVLRPEEDDVLRILQETVEPRILRIHLNGATVLTRLKGEESPVTLSSLGEGVQRMLIIAIALVSAKGKMLLIDEFEAGLHHSVQKKLWEMVFEYATKWDIQVFATTHSQDTVRNFFYVASRPENENEATYLRLQFDRMGVHEAQVYDMERLEQSLEMNLETR